jgi:hypothetical protein
MPRPVLQAMVLADHVYQDRLTGKSVIAGTFATILFGSISAVQSSEVSPGSEEEATQVVFNGPISRIGSPYLYLALVEVHGQVPLTLKYVDLSDASVLFEAQVVVASVDPVAVAEYVLPIPPLPANKAGTYSLDLLYDGEILGSWRVVARKLEDQPGAGA